MTDIVERLREAIRDPECPVQFSPILMAARAEIERLREEEHYAKCTAEAQDDAIHQAHVEIERLTAEVSAWRGVAGVNSPEDLWLQMKADGERDD